MVLESQASKLSAQSPPWSRNRSPRAASANCFCSAPTSHDVTSGGSFEICETTSATSDSERYNGCCAAGLVFQDAGDQSPFSAFDPIMQQVSRAGGAMHSGPEDCALECGADPLVRAGPPGPAFSVLRRPGRRGRRPRTRGSAPPPYLTTSSARRKKGSKPAGAPADLALRTAASAAAVLQPRLTNAERTSC